MTHRPIRCEMNEATMTETRPVVAETRAELAQAYAGGARDQKRAVVMTMGALHEGHAELIRVAQEMISPAGHLTVTIFVNPLQFGANEDLDEYPRTHEADLASCASLGVDLVFAPTTDVIYPDGDPLVTIDPGPLGDVLEGAARPGHFSGVLTVVCKLLNLTAPDLAMFGEKDYQQLTLVRQMVHDLDLPVTIIGVPTVRADDSLALSSRNKYLDTESRAAALVIPAAIRVAQDRAAAGDAEVAVLAAANAVLAVSGVDVEYLVATDPAMGPAPDHGEARVIIAAYVAGTRLLDNGRIDLRARARGSRCAGPAEVR